MNLPNLTKDNLFKFIGFTALTLIILCKIYYQIFPENIESLFNKSDAEWAEAQQKAEELERLGHEENKENTSSENTAQQDNHKDETASINKYDYLSLPVRILAGFLGLFFVYIAIFLYEDAEGKIQNKLENIWVKINDAQNFTLSKHTVFVNSVAKLSASFFRFLFGAKLVSIQAIGVSICYAVSSANFVLFYFSDNSLSNSYFFSCVYWFCLGTIPALIRGSFWTKLWFALVVFFAWDDFISGYVFMAYFANSFSIPVMIVVAFGMIIGVSIGCLLFLLSILIIRKTLQKISVSESFWKTAIFPLFNCIPILMLYVLFNSYFFFTSSYNEINGIFWLILLFTGLHINIIFLLPALLFFFVSLLLFLHKIFWGIIDKPIYALQKLGIAKRSKLLGTAGALLIVASVGRGDWIEKIIDKLNPF